MATLEDVLLQLDNELGSTENPERAEELRQQINLELKANGLGWFDLTEFLLRARDIPQPPTPTWVNNKAPRWIKVLIGIHRKYGSPATSAGEAEGLRQKLFSMLAKQSKGWPDLPEMVEAFKAWERAQNPQPQPSPDSSPTIAPDGPKQTGDNILSSIAQVYQSYLSFQDPSEYVACALWCMATWVYDCFTETPILVFRSNVEGEGKTTALKVTRGFVFWPKFTKNLTPASFYRVIDEGFIPIIDEADNLDIHNNKTWIGILNSAFEEDATVLRVIKNKLVDFHCYRPVALGMLGSELPPSTASRTITIPLRRDREASQRLQKLNMRNPTQKKQFDDLKYWLAVWAGEAKANIDMDPKMPAELNGRQRDAWRPLIAVADICSPEAGKLVRKIAVEMVKRRNRDENRAITLLRDIRDHVFTQPNVTDRVTSSDMLDILHDLPHGYWSVWTGLNHTHPERNLTERELASILWNTFQISRPTSIRTSSSTGTKKGYYRRWFERAWAAYLDEPPQPSGAKPRPKPKGLSGPKRRKARTQRTGRKAKQRNK